MLQIPICHKELQEKLICALQSRLRVLIVLDNGILPVGFSSKPPIDPLTCFKSNRKFSVSFPFDPHSEASDKLV